MSKRLVFKVKNIDVSVPVTGQEHEQVEAILRGLGIKGIKINSLTLNETSLNKSTLSIYLTDLDLVQYKRGVKELKKPSAYADSVEIHFKLDEEKLLARLVENTKEELQKHFKAGYEACKADQNDLVTKVLENNEELTKGKGNGKKRKA